jgi:hypothetical protein
MKIRIKGNSVRYRLTRSEVARLGEDGYLQEATNFASQTFHYSIERTDSDQLRADFLQQNIVVYMPQAMIDEWVQTDRITFEDKSGPVRILMEKDFVCLDHTEEDQSDNYPNPNKTC